MVEWRRVVEMWKGGELSTLATLVRVEGSSYRRPGARLAIDSRGNVVGAISGGCLEADLIRKAKWFVRDGARVETYSTLFDEAAEIPYGLGCGGVVDVLVEPATTPEACALLQALAASLAGERLRVDTWLPGKGQPLQRQVTTPEGQVRFQSDGLLPPVDEAFREDLDPPQTLHVCGAGDDAVPLVHLAAFMGWRVLVWDGRRHLARRERFPGAAEVTATLAVVPGQVAPEDAVMIMTHSYEQDRSWLEQMLPWRPRYLGLLGSRHRSALLIAEAAQALGWSLQEACQDLFSPAGLDLGGDGAEAIALSVLSEVQACTKGKLGQSRRMLPGIVEAQLADGGSSYSLQSRCSL